MSTCPRPHTLQANPGRRFCEACGTVLKDEAQSEGGSVQGRRTMVDPMVPATPVPPAAFPVPAQTPPPAVPRRGDRTILDSGPGPQVPGDPEPADQPILAALVSHTWKPGGEIHPIRGERTRFGRTDCEVAFPNDRTMTGHHGTILIRLKGKRVFTISDQGSQNGTYLNGELIEEARVLNNYDLIRAGATELRFVILDPTLLKEGE